MPVENSISEIRNNPGSISTTASSQQNIQKNERIEKLSQHGAGQFLAILSDLTKDTRVMKYQSGNGYSMSKHLIKAYVPQELSGFATNIDKAA